MLKVYKYPEVPDQDKTSSGDLLYGIQDGKSVTPLPFFTNGNNSAIIKFEAVEFNQFRNEINRISLDTSIIDIDTTNNIYNVDSLTDYVTALNNGVYRFEFQNDSNLWQTEYFKVTDFGYFPEYQAVYDYWTTKPSNLIAGLQNTMVKGLVDSGVWEIKDVFYVFAAHINTDGEALVNWKNPGVYDATLINNPDFVAFEGFKGDGTTKSINTNYNAFVDGVNFTLNNGSLSIYSRTDTNESAQDIGDIKDSDNTFIFMRTSGNFFPRINTLTSSSIPVTDSLGLFVSNRVNATEQEGYKNKSLLITDINNSSGIPNGDIYIMSRDGLTFFSSRQYSMSSIGSGMTQQNINDEYDYFQAYMTSNGKQV